MACHIAAAVSGYCGTGGTTMESPSHGRSLLLLPHSKYFTSTSTLLLFPSQHLQPVIQQLGATQVMPDNVKPLRDSS